MKVAFDTSVLVAGMVAHHPSYALTRPWLERVFQGEAAGVICAHSLAEFYSAVTRLSLQPRIGPAAADELIRENLSRHFEVLSLTAQDYRVVLASCARRQIAGGAVYDALIAHVVLMSSADVLVTLNPRHFLGQSPELDTKIRVPGSDDLAGR